MNASRSSFLHSILYDLRILNLINCHKLILRVNIQDSFDHHRATPEVSLNEYVCCRKIKLGEWVMARRRIYLDKCFWICLRDARIGRINDPVALNCLMNLCVVCVRIDLFVR